MMTGYFNTLSKELDEAVMIDGGSRWKALWSILVPISIPGMVSVGMYIHAGMERISVCLNIDTDRKYAYRTNRYQPADGTACI